MLSVDRVDNIVLIILLIKLIIILIVVEIVLIHVVLTVPEQLPEKLKKNSISLCYMSPPQTGHQQWYNKNKH